MINTKRIFYLAIIAIPIRIANICLFAFSSSYDTPILIKWSRGIILSHFVLLLFMILFLGISIKYRNHTEPNFVMNALQYTTAIVIMMTGIIIVAFDQLVTSNITPFLLICIVIGSVFLFRPLISFVLFFSSYIMYYYSLGLTTANPEVLLSNRVNGITAVGVGFLLSIIMWRYNYTNINQKRRIESQQKQLEQMAYYDPLTGLPNRRFFDNLVTQELNTTQQEDHKSIIIILDIDNFKQINDTYGHPAGDYVLKEISDVLVRNIRNIDTVSRFGGEEFSILMPKSTIEDGLALAEQLRHKIMSRTFMVEGNAVQVTSSFGVSFLYEEGDNENCVYYELADQALYKAKQKGKNRVEKYCNHHDD